MSMITMVKKQNFIIFFITVLLQSAQSRIDGKTLLHWGGNFTDVVLESPIVSRKCEQQRICKEVQNYPKELVKSLLDELKTKNINKFSIENLKADNGDFENICSEKEEIYFPLAAKDNDGDWQFILNRSSQAFQGFSVEFCKQRCLHRSLPFSSDYNLRCIQKDVYRKMVYLDIEKRRLAIGHFEVPTCCSCSLTNY